MQDENQHRKAIAQRLREARIRAGYKTAFDFAKKFNIPQSTFSLHETGERGLKLDLAKRYCDYLAVDISWLLTGVNYEIVQDDSSDCSEQRSVNIDQLASSEKPNHFDKQTNQNQIDFEMFNFIMEKIVDSCSKNSYKHNYKVFSKLATHIYNQATQASSERKTQEKIIDIQIQLLETTLECSLELEMANKVINQ